MSCKEFTTLPEYSLIGSSYSARLMLIAKGYCTVPGNKGALLFLETKDTPDW